MVTMLRMPPIMTGMASGSLIFSSICMRVLPIPFAASKRAGETLEIPVCVLRTTRVYVVPFREVTAEHAFKEGEGDRTLASWRAVHQAFFTGELERAGLTFTEETPVVCEEFEVAFRP